MKNLSLSISFVAAALCFSGCATKEVVTVEKKKGVTIVHHRSRTSNGARDRIEAINAKGVVTTAEVHVYDLGRMPDGNGGLHEAHRYYQVAESPHFDLRLPRASGNTATGPKTVYTPPNYSPPPKDQRINDAVAEAKQAASDLKAAKEQVAKRLAEDNNLRGELQTQIDENQRLQDQINAAMNTPSRQKVAPQTDAQKAAESATAVTELQKWGQTVQ